MTNKQKQTSETVDIKQLVDAYRQRFEAWTQEIETVCMSRDSAKNNFSVLPRYLEEVIIPVCKCLAEKIPEHNIQVPDPKTERPIANYYRIRVGLRAVGGFSVPINNDFALYFTPMWQRNRIGERIEIEQIDHLVQLIRKQLEIDKQVL